MNRKTKLITILLLTTLTLTTVTLVGAGLIGDWDFDEGNGKIAYDSSGGNNHGTLTGGAFGGCLLFDGVDDYVSVPDSASLDLSTAITIEAWIYINEYPTIIDGSTLSKRWAYYFDVKPDGKIGAFTYGTNPQEWFISDSSVPLKQWTHVAFTYDGSYIKLYINGVEDKSAARTGLITTTNEWVAMGRVGTAGGVEPGRAFNGMIDEVKISNVAKTSFDLNSPPDTTDAVALWHFDESTGQMALDSAGSNNGQLGSTAGIDSNDPIWVSAGPTWVPRDTGYALCFDGIDDVVYIANEPNFDFDLYESFSIEAWFKTDSDNLMNIISKYEQNDPNRGYQLIKHSKSYDNNHLYFFLTYDAAGTGGNQIRTHGVTDVSDGLWHHVVVTYDGSGSASGVKMYLDGIPEPLSATATSVTGTTLNDLPLQISGREGTYWVFDGCIDEVKVWSNTLLPPVADAGGPYELYEGDPTDSALKLIGSGSTDPEGGSLTYEWDWNSDGTYDYTGVVDPYTNVYDSYSEGDYTVTLRVTDETGLSDTDTTTVKIYKLNVAKDASTSYTRTFTWGIEKSASPTSHVLVKGDTGTSTYTVSVDKTTTDSDWAVSGTITIENPSSLHSIWINSVSDVISGSIPATIDTEIIYPYELEAGNTLTLTYSAILPNGVYGTNMVTVTASSENGFVFTCTASDGVLFGEPTTTNGYPTINVIDTNDKSWSASEDATWTYDRTFTHLDGGTHNNVATITETDQSDDASVSVTVYELSVTKTAYGEFTRTYNWDIEKSVEPTQIHFPDDSGVVEYTVGVTQTGYEDSAFGVSGTITVHNPATKSVQILSVTDLLPTGLTPITYGPTTPCLIAPGQTLEWTYSGALPDASSGRINNVAVTIQNTPEGTTDFTGQAFVEFNGPTTEVNKEIHISDTNGQNWQTSTSNTWTYPVTFTPMDVGVNTNTATIDETQQSSQAEVWVETEISGTKTVYGTGTVLADWTIINEMFCDDFESGLTGWNVIGGTWSLVDESGNNVYSGTSTADEQVTYALSTQHYEDFTFEADLKAVNNNGHYGVILREDGYGNHYGFYLNAYSGSEGQYWFGYWDGTHHAIIGWTSSGGAYTDANEWNSLKVVAKGYTFELYINDELLTTVTDTSMYASSGYVGLIVDYYMGSGQNTYYDNVCVYQKTTTDSNGDYSFTATAPGTYRILEEQQKGWTQVTPESYYTVTLPGKSDGLDFENFKWVTVSGYKYDTNDNALDDWEILLTKTDNDPVSVFTGTDPWPNGYYEFIITEPGEYTLNEVLKSGWTMMEPEGPQIFTVISGQDKTQDFVNFEWATVSGYKYEYGATFCDDFEGYEFGGDGSPTWTADSGAWTVVEDGIHGKVYYGKMIGRTFANVEADTNSMCISTDFKGLSSTSPTGWSNGFIVFDYQDPLNFKRAGLGVGDPRYIIAETVNGIDMTHVSINAPEITRDTWYNLKVEIEGDKVYLIVDGYLKADYTFSSIGNGKIGVETSTAESYFDNFCFQPKPLEDWRFVLYNELGEQVDEYVTGPNGRYEFTIKEPGTYDIYEDIKDGWTLVSPIVDNPLGPGEQLGYTIEATTGAEISGKDFYNFKWFTLYGVKFFDANQNGEHDQGEPLLDGWEITLEFNGETITDITDSNGYYSFLIQHPGDYTVSEETRLYWIKTTPEEGMYQFTAVSGQDVEVDFGNLLGPSWITSSSFCSFDNDEAYGRQFRLIYTPDFEDNVNQYKLSASNPGQFYYNIFYYGTPEDAFVISLGEHFETQGANPVHVYSSLSFDEEGCIVPGEDVTDQFTVEYFGGEIHVTMDEPTEGFYYINVHCDYDLKGTGGYELEYYVDNDGVVRGNALIDLDAVNLEDILDMQSYYFSVSGAMDHETEVMNRNEFKKFRGIIGFVTDSLGDPIVGVTVTISGEAIGEVVFTTDGDGFYGYSYFHLGKPATYTITFSTVPEKTYEIVLKAGRFAVVSHQTE